jgi:hypothetical protein
MSTQQIAESSRPGVVSSPQAPLYTTFVAIVLGTSFVEFNEFLFPPKLSSLNFWALLAVYYAAFSVWFGTSTMSRARPFLDNFLSRVWLLMGVIAFISFLALMYFATKATDSYLQYMWGWVIAFIFLELGYIFRHLDTRLPEPIGLGATFTLIAVVSAIAYSVWVLVFPPIPIIANWVFVFASFATIVSFRTLVRARRTWQPVPVEQ